MSKRTATQVYGWTPQAKDQRDLTFKPSRKTLKAKRPTNIDMTAKCPPVYDQGPLGSCTGNGIAGVHEYDQIKQGKVPFTPSRLAIYYDERKKEGTIKSDAGANIRDGIKVIAALGVADEKLWPYKVSKFAVSPGLPYYTEALKHRALIYRAVGGDATSGLSQLEQILCCLAEGFTVVFGFTVYESFESAAVAATGVMPLPKRGEQVLGGHCVVMVGYDDTKGVFICRNSWGAGWGKGGYFTMPYGNLPNCSDFWQVTSVA